MEMPKRINGYALYDRVEFVYRIYDLVTNELIRTTIAEATVTRQWGPNDRYITFVTDDRKTFTRDVSSSEVWRKGHK